MATSPARSIGINPLPFRMWRHEKALRAEAAKAFRRLRDLGFRYDRIKVFEAALTGAVAMRRLSESWPTAGDDRKAVADVHKLTDLLDSSLAALSPMASGAIAAALARLRTGQDVPPMRVLEAQLRVLATACKSAVDEMPVQSRRSNHKGIVRAVAELVAPLGMHVTPTAGTPFYQACEAAFALADVTAAVAKKGTTKRRDRATRPSPAASIKAYLRDINGK